MKTTLFLALATTLLLAGCKKDDPEVQLPAATQTGANTAGCLIDGNLFVATGWGSNSIYSNKMPALDGGFAFDSVYFLQMAGQYQGRNAYVMVFMRPVTFPGLYKFNRNTLYYPQGSPLRISSHATFSFDDSNEVYVTDALHTGQVIMTRAELKNGVGIGSGTFEFVAASKVDPTRTVSITSGRFDYKQ